VTCSDTEKPHELGPDWGLFFWLLARYLDPVSDRTFHEMRTAAFLRRAELADTEAYAVMCMLTGVELAELRGIINLGCCHVPNQGLAQRLADFRLIRAANVADANAWVVEPWGRLVAQAAKEGAQ
jgi:predicted amidohydrolase